jgi:hypothetical protein
VLNYTISTLHLLFVVNSIKEDEMGKECSKHGENGKYIQYFCWKAQGG